MTMMLGPIMHRQGGTCDSDSDQDEDLDNGELTRAVNVELQMYRKAKDLQNPGTRRFRP